MQITPNMNKLWTPLSVPHTMVKCLTDRWWKKGTIAARELTHALQNPTPASPVSNIGDKQMEALQQLAELFQQEITKIDTTSNSVTPPNITEKRLEPQVKI